MTIKEPFVYNEEVTYSGDLPLGSNTFYVLSELENVFPFGYPTEQFLKQTK